MTRVFAGAVRTGFGLVLLVAINLRTGLAEDPPAKNYSVTLSASVQESPPRILLTWAGDTAATAYTISRRTGTTAWQYVATIHGSAATYSDYNITVGTKYEYQFIKTTSGNYTGYGYISAGIRLPVQSYFGKVVLVVENSLSQVLAPELKRLHDDLRTEGWDVVQRNVGITESPQTVKQIIRDVYNSDPANVRAVFLFGHVPVPYSGDIMPDSHPNHRGAWPADLYYADMDGVWTDSTVNVTAAERQVNWNVPGDGKFDQSELPSPLELWVGRVDLSRMTCYANKAAPRSEVDLMRQYLNKNHAFRSGQLQVERRGLVCDNVLEMGDDPVSSSAWRNFPAFFGANKTTEVGWLGYLPAATSGSYLWSFASGGGSYYTSAGVATADDFALQEVRVVFTMFVGSYFGDWNNESNFLRAALGSGDVLAASYSGLPNTLYFPMALGEPIGYAMWLTQHNSPGGLYPPWNNGAGEVHVSLLGDPTLRMHPVLPPGKATASVGNGVSITWTASPDSAIEGYLVYRANSAAGEFDVITGSGLVQGTSFHDPAGTDANAYMVRAVKLERSGSGTYLNPSRGVFATRSAGTISAPTAPSNVGGVALSSSQIRIHWIDNSNNETGFRVYRKVGPNGAYSSFIVGANSTSYMDSGLSAGTEYFYKIVAYNVIGNSQETAEVRVSTAVAESGGSAVFVRSDTTTAGSWKGVYGRDGAVAPYSDFSWPPSVQINGYQNYPVTWQNPSASPLALEKRLSTSRFATYFHHTNSFYIYLQFKDTGTHRVSFYFCDFENLGRRQNIEIFDYTSGDLLSSNTVSNFQNGRYLTWDLKGKVTIKFSATGPGGAVLSGIFWDPVDAPAPPVPDETEGSSALFVKTDAVTSGTWKGVYGAQGQIASYSDFSWPTNVQVNAYHNYSLVWENPSQRAAALQKRTSTSRFATCWQNNGPFFFYLQFKDTAKHRVSFYFLDFDGLGRRQLVEFFDYSTGDPLGSATVSGFQGGLYSTWDLKGKITIKITPLTSGTAVMSGIFFDSISTVPAPVNAVRYLGANSTASGNWKGTFGGNGFQIAGEVTKLPASATVTFSGKSDHIWNWNPPESAALQRAGSAGRIAACWYATEAFEIAVNVTGGLTQKVSFYSLDWDQQNRTQRIDVFNAATGGLLHSVNLSGFPDGMYHSYDVKGSIRFRFVRTGPRNSVISGIFFDPPSGTL